MWYRAFRERLLLRLIVSSAPVRPVAEHETYTNRFGLGNWTGLAALVVVLGLPRHLQRRRAPQAQSQALEAAPALELLVFAIVVLHAFFCGAILRVTSPFTILLCLAVVAVVVGQVVGIWPWRRRYVRIRGE